MTNSLTSAVSLALAKYSRRRRGPGMAVLLMVLMAGTATGVHAAQPGWPPMFGSQLAQPQATPGFPFGQPTTPRRSAPAFPFPWMGGAQTAPSQPWNNYGTPATPFGAQSGFSPFNPMAMMGGMGGMGSMGGMGMMAAPMMGFMAPMMTNYAIASMNPTTMGNFFGLMANPGGGMMPFGGFGFPSGGYGAPAAPFQNTYRNQGSVFPWTAQPAAPAASPWSPPVTRSPYGSARQSAPAFPPFFPFFNQSGGRR